MPILCSGGTWPVSTTLHLIEYLVLDNTILRVKTASSPPLNIRFFSFCFLTNHIPGFHRLSPTLQKLYKKHPSHSFPTIPPNSLIFSKDESLQSAAGSGWCPSSSGLPSQGCIPSSRVPSTRVCTSTGLPTAGIPTAGIPTTGLPTTTGICSASSSTEEL